MERGRSRVLALLVVYLGLVGAALFALDWFVASTPFGIMTIDMRSAQVCSTDGACVSFSLSEMRGRGPTLSAGASKRAANVSGVIV